MTDTQSRISTVRGETFPYQLGLDFFRKNVVVFNTQTQKVMSVSPAEAQRLANDSSLDPHRHALYAAVWSYWQSQGKQSC